MLTVAGPEVLSIVYALDVLAFIYFFVSWVTFSEKHLPWGLGSLFCAGLVDLCFTVPTLGPTMPSQLVGFS